MQLPRRPASTKVCSVEIKFEFDNLKGEGYQDYGRDLRREGRPAQYPGQIWVE